MKINQLYQGILHLLRTILPTTTEVKKLDVGSNDREYLVTTLNEEPKVRKYRARLKVTEDSLLEAAYTVKLMVGSYPKRGHGNVVWHPDWQKAIEAADMPSSSCYNRRYGTLKAAWDAADEWGRAKEALESQESNQGN